MIVPPDRLGCAVAAMPTATAAQHDAASTGHDAPDTPRRQRVLMLCHRLPYPPDRGDRIRSWNLIKFLSRHVDLSVACVSEEAVWLQHHQLLSTMARNVAIYPISNSWTKLKAVRALLTGRAITPYCHFREGLSAAIMQWQEIEPFDAVLTFCTGMIDYARIIVGDKLGRPPLLTTTRARHVIDLVDVDSAKWRSYAKTTRPPMSWVYRTEASRLRRIEACEFDHVDAVTVVSDNEADAYRQHVTADQPVTVVRNGVDIDYFGPLPDTDAKRIVFVGVLNYWPNTQGITWFVDHVMPKLRERVPDIELQIVGRHPTARIQELGERPGVEVVGSVPDVRAYMADASVIVAPLLIARGTQNKVLEGMASQRVVVCSTGAYKGIDALDGQHVLVADEPDQWVEHITTVMQDTTRRQTLAEAARRRIEERYAWDTCLSPMLDLLGVKQNA